MGALGRTPPLPWLKPAVLTGSLVPIAAILLRTWRDDLGADPIAQALNQLGLVALIFLVAALGCTPLKTIAGWTWQMRIRRMLGLLAFFYACLYVITHTAIRSGPGLARDCRRHRKAEVYFFRVFHFCAAASAGCDIDQLCGPAPGLSSVETASSPRLRGPGAGRSSFHLEG